MRRMGDGLIYVCYSPSKVQTKYDSRQTTQNVIGKIMHCDPGKDRPI